MSVALTKKGILHIFKPREACRAFVKMILFVGTVLFYFLGMGILKMLCSFFPFEKTKDLPNTWTHLCAKWCLYFMQVRVRQYGDFLPGGVLLVGNHLSYVDALVLASLSPCHFVTSIEIKKTLGLGQICQLANCLFVERRSRNFLTQEIAEISQTLRQDRKVVVFPEGTSTNGEKVLRFKRPLFQAALDSKRPVQTFCLNYLGFNERDDICWYGDMKFIPHLRRFFKLHSLKVDVILGDQALEGEEPTELSQFAHGEVSQRFKTLS